MEYIEAETVTIETESVVLVADTEQLNEIREDITAGFAMIAAFFGIIIGWFVIRELLRIWVR